MREDRIIEFWSLLSILTLGLGLMTASIACTHPHDDDEDAEFEEFARRLQSAGKPCVKVLSVERTGTGVVVVCQQVAGRPSSRVTHALSN